MADGWTLDAPGGWTLDAGAAPRATPAKAPAAPLPRAQSGWTLDTGAAAAPAGPGPKPVGASEYRHQRLNARVEGAFADAQKAGQKAAAVPQDVAGGRWGQAAKDAIGAPLAAGSALFGGATALPLSYTDVAMRPLEKKAGLPAGQISDDAGMVGSFLVGGGKALSTKPGQAVKKSAEALVNPANVDDNARAAAAIHRANLGKFGLTADKETYQLSKHAKTLSKLSPQQRLDFIDYVEHRSQRPHAPDTPAAATMDVSSRLSPGMARASAKATEPMADTPLRKAADAIAGVSERYRKRIDYVLGPDDRRNYIRDYYAHMWKQKPEEVEARMAAAVGGKQGSGRNLRKRTVPTIAEGIKLGLEPRYDNPVDTMVAYNETMAKFLRTHAIKDEMIKAGQARWAFPGKQPAGWVELKGAITKRKPQPGSRPAAEAAEPAAKPPLSLPGPKGKDLADPGSWTVTNAKGEPVSAGGELVREPGVLPQAGIGGPQVGSQIEDAAAGARRIEPKAKPGEPPQRTQRDQAPVYEQLYAPEGAARIYNNHISQGLDTPGAGGNVYRGARAVNNGLVGVRLGLSGFHAATMANEAVTSAVARAVEEASRGKILSAAKSAASAATSPITTPLRGRRMFKEIVGDIPADKIPEFNTRLNGLYEKAGGRLHMDRIYSVRGAGSLFQSLNRGTFFDDAKAAVKQTYSGTAGENVKGALDLAGNVLQSTAAPLFEAYVPALKRGAWAERMSAYLRDHPGATEAEQEAAGRGFLDNVDNRFGELMVDNNFWHKAGFQVSQLAMLSPSWNLGTIREIGGGLAEMPKSAKGLVTGKGVTPKTAYVLALLATNAILNGSATYMKTGTMPEGLDWFAYRTGGQNADGSPERAALPGYMKDILSAVLGDPKQEIANKLSPGLKEAWELYNNKDFRGLPIYKEDGDQQLPDGHGLGDYLLEENTPISVQAMTKGQKQGSNVSPAETVAGIRPSPRYVQNPSANKAQTQKRNQSAWKRKLKADARSEAARAPAAGGWSVQDANGWKLN